MITAVLPIREASQIADARRRAVDRAHGLSLGELPTGQLSIIVTELATNLVKFARDGMLLLDTYEDADGEGIQVLALDKGPGMNSVARCMQDGFSTAGSAGTGLGAVRRLANAFAIESWPSGTGVMARVGTRKTVPPSFPTWSTLEVPLKGEESCGDAICARKHLGGWTVLVADGLGHGPMAAGASVEAVRQFRHVDEASPGEIIERIHSGLRHTRGAAVAAARYDEARGILAFAGIGNIAGTIVTGSRNHHLVSLAGTAGHNARKISTFDYAFAPGSLLVMHSDGISSSWSLGATPGLAAAHPALVAGILFRDYARARDDASVIVVRDGRAS